MLEVMIIEAYVKDQLLFFFFLSSFKYKLTQKNKPFGAI